MTTTEPLDTESSETVDIPKTEPVPTGRADTTDSTGEHGRRRRWPWVLVVLAIAAVVAFVVAEASSTTTSLDTTNQEFSTATVKQLDLVVTETVSGTLGYGEAEAIAFRTSPDGVDNVYGALAGVVTSAPDEGVVVVAGDVLYEVNAAPVVVLYGDTPVYRALDRRTSDGEDILFLEQSLVDLGYDPDGDITIDEEFTTATRAAIELLQEDIGANVDGGFALGEMLFTPGPTYVAEALVRDGDQVQSGQNIIALSAAPSGTFTWIAEEGAIVEQGDVLYRVDNQPTVLLHGEVPAYRAMASGDSGSDVTQLQTALIDLGFATDDLANGEFDDATLRAVVAWQLSNGAHPDGVVNLGEVVFLPGSLRIGEVVAATGDTTMNGSPVIMTSASSTFVTVELATTDQSLVSVGDTVDVELPDEVVVEGTITSVGTVAQTNQAGESFFEMIVAINDTEATAGLDEAPVDVAIVSDSAGDVYAVPVTALVALAEGGYAVEVVDSGTTYLIGVETGLFADGLVEVTGSGLSAGLLVVVP
jgi:peptidoglycan hydrolase-like protein with peptidoglycan-binding domain